MTINDNDELISVIVPVYNTEKYLPNCLDSLIAQTYKNIEIICIDNGSIDESFKVLQRYQKKHKNINAVTHKEGRQGDARNYGIKIAKGKYIGFVDSDDYVDHMMYQKMYDMIKEKDTEIVICNIEVFYQESNRRFEFTDNVALQNKRKYTCGENPKILRNLTICNKLFSTELLKRAELEFPKGVVHEDQYFVGLALLCAKGIRATGEALYVYRKEREGSVSSNIGNNFQDIFKVMALLEERVIKMHLDPELFKEFKVYRYYVLYKGMNKVGQKKYYHILSKEFKKIGSIDSQSIITGKEINEIYRMSVLPYILNSIYVLLYRLYARIISIRKNNVQD